MTCMRHVTYDRGINQGINRVQSEGRLEPEGKCKSPVSFKDHSGFRRMGRVGITST